MKKYYRLLAISAIISIFSFTAKAVELQEFIESSSHQNSIEELMSPNTLIPTSVFVVNNTGDNSDALPGDGLCDDGGGCSFRCAIQEANAFAGANIIDFNIHGGCHQTIYPSVALPTITEAESKAKAEEKPSEEQISIQNALTRFEGVRLGVKNSGYYRVSAAELFANGMPVNANPNGLRLFADGIEQPINAVLNENGTLGWIEFYGIGIDSTETDLRNYQLIASTEQGRRIEKNHSEGSPSNQTFYTATVERQDRTLYFAGLLNDQKENFFGAVINSNGTQTDLMLRNLVEMGGNAEIYVKLQGLTRSSHNVKVEINGQFIGNLNFEAMLKGTLEAQISTGLLREGTNKISFTSLSGTNDLSLIEDIQIKFPRELKAYENRIEITAQSGQEITVEGFTSGEVRVFDVTDANNVFELSAKVSRNENGREAANSTEIFKVGFTPPGNGERKILALANNSNLAEISPNLASDLRTTQGGDLLIITKREMFRSMYPLMKQRQGQGLRSVLADVQDIYDKFNFSQKSTQAIKNFLQFANANW